MADGLSLVASIIAVLGAADTIGKTLSRVKVLRSAPDEVLALNNEISDLTITLRNVDSCISMGTTQGIGTTDRRAIPKDVFQHMSTLITRAKDQLLQLEQLIHYRILKSGSFDGEYKVFRARWVRARSTVESHRQALRDVRQNIVMQLLIINSSHQSRAHLTVEEIFVISHEVQATHHQSIEQASSQRNTQTGLLTDIANDITRLRSTLQSVTRNDPYPQRSRPTHSLQPWTILGIKAGILNPQLHQRVFQCKCSCHGPHRFRSPRLFENILGALFIGYSGYPFNIWRCASAACEAHSAFEARVQYLFPSWLFQKLVEMALIMSSFQEPHVALTVRAVLPISADIFRVSMSNNVDGLKHLFSSGHARPNDSPHPHGDNALWFALTYRCLEACKVLLAAGSDPYYEDQSQNSSFDLAWTRILTGSEDQTTLEALRRLFPINDNYLEIFQFSKLHRAVLGLDSCDLREVIMTSGPEIDVPDSKGRTALSWAVRRDDIVAINLLLNAKADPNIASLAGNTPLFEAVFKGSLASVKLLLNAGALVTHNNNASANALHCAARGIIHCYTPHSLAFNHCDCLKIIDLLVKLDVDIEAQSVGGYSPLLHAVATNNIHMIQALLEFRAKINSSNLEGDTSVMVSAFCGFADATSLLLQHGADYTSINKAGYTILHYAAKGGSLKTLEILHATNLTNINPYARNTDSETAFEIAQKRHDRPEGFVELFQTLIFEIVNRNDKLASQRAAITGAVTGEPAEDATNSTGTEQRLNIPGAWPEE